MSFATHVPEIKFKPFSSIENSYQEEIIEAMTSQNLLTGEWVVLEKVHGANFSFICNGVSISCAKRTTLLAPDENFYNFQKLLEDYSEKIFKAYSFLKSRQPSIETIHIFGELFGGIYPHPSVPKIKDVQHIQKGVYYAPHVDFYAFDVHNGQKYLDYYEAVEVFQAGELFYAEPLLTGPYEEVIKYDQHFLTRVPNRYNLPEISGNLAEGVVIRPVVTRYMRTGSRVILKHKIEAFTERHKRLPKEGVPKRGEKEDLPHHVQFLVDELLSLLNVNRLNNVISKIGEVTKKDSSKLMGLLSKDALEEFMKLHGEKFNSLPDEHKKKIKQIMSKDVQVVLHEYFQQEEEEN